MNWNQTCIWTLVVMLVSLTTSGCGGGASAGARGKEASHVQAISVLYLRAASSLGRNPTDAEEFKRSIADVNPDLSVLGVGSIDELFVSDRDGKPLVVLYGNSPAGVAPGVIVYEQEGRNGVRLVGSSNGQVGEADADAFAKFVPTPVAAP